MDDERLISVIMPAYDVAPFVAEAVESVRAQDWPAIELIAVDDGSTDGTGETLDRLAATWDGPGRRMVVVHQPNGGLAAACNAALARATGRHVVFCDGDDRWRPGLLPTVAAHLDARDDLDIVFPRYVYIDEGGAPFGMESPRPRARYDADAFLVENPLHSATGTLVRGEAARANGPLDESLRACIHLDWFLRMTTRRPGNVGGVDRVLVDYRRRRGQITSDWRRMQTNWHRAVDKRAVLAPVPARRVVARARARQAVFWSALAYQAGEHAASRRLILSAWTGAPRAIADDWHAWVRLGAGLATLLPGPVHDAVARGFNALRARLGRDTS